MYLLLFIRDGADLTLSLWRADPDQEEVNSIPARPSAIVFIPISKSVFEPGDFPMVVCLLEQEAQAGMSGFPRTCGEQPVLCSHPGCPLLAMCVGRMEVKLQVPLLCLGPSWWEWTRAAHQALPLAAKILQQHKMITIANSAQISSVGSFLHALLGGPPALGHTCLLPLGGRSRSKVAVGRLAFPSPVQGESCVFIYKIYLFSQAIPVLGVRCWWVLASPSPPAVLGCSRASQEDEALRKAEIPGKHHGHK